MGTSRIAGSKLHFILVVYDNYDQMEKGRSIFTSCPESAKKCLQVFLEQPKLTEPIIG